MQIHGPPLSIAAEAHLWALQLQPKCRGRFALAGGALGSTAPPRVQQRALERLSAGPGLIMASETTQRGDTRLRLSPRPAASKQRRRILVLHLKRARLKRAGRMFKTNSIRPEVRRSFFTERQNKLKK